MGIVGIFYRDDGRGAVILNVREVVKMGQAKPSPSSPSCPWSPPGIHCFFLCDLRKLRGLGIGKGWEVRLWLWQAGLRHFTWKPLEHRTGTEHQE